jgi:hypothetical protein
MRRLLLLLFVGWLPPYLCPSGACLTLGTSLLSKPQNAAEGDTTPGLRLCRCTLASCRVDRFLSYVPSRAGVILGDDRDLRGNGPHAAGQLTGNGYGHHLGVLPSCRQLPVTFTPSDLGLPTDVLDHFRLFFQSQL